MGIGINAAQIAGADKAVVQNILHDFIRDALLGVNTIAPLRAEQCFPLNVGNKNIGVAGIGKGTQKPLEHIPVRDIISSRIRILHQALLGQRGNAFGVPAQKLIFIVLPVLGNKKQQHSSQKQKADQHNRHTDLEILFK